jgi:SAM-dependent methyltransferase
VSAADKPPAACRICGGATHSVLYRGPVRVGKFGSLTAEPRSVWRCDQCGAGFLPVEPVDYESSEYRTLVDGSGGAVDFYRNHDGEQAEKLRMVGTAGLRGLVCMDVGCGAGSFLDVLRGLARVTIGVEPTGSLRSALGEKGHLAFPYCKDVPQAWTDRVDLAVAFSLVEHVEDPLELLVDLRRLLRPGGRLVVSTPNRRDWLLDVLPDEYGCFFYRIVHLWYFDAASLAELLRIAGFTDVTVRSVHRFDLSNAVLWLRDKRPTGLAGLELPATADGVYRAMLESSGRADYLYASCRKA